MIEVLYRDEFLAVVNKPTALMVHDSKLAGGESEFLADQLKAQFAQNVFLIHRLDRATSGCLLLAFDRDTASLLGKDIMANTVRKNYLAVCRGWPEAEAASIDYPLDGGPGKRLKKPAITHYQMLARGELDEACAGFDTSRFALLECHLDTGRFRQIRRHLKHIHHHLIGDTSHGDGRRNRQFRMRGVHRMLLHAWQLQISHPHTHDVVHVAAGLDQEFNRALQLFDWELPAVSALK